MNRPRIKCAMCNRLVESIEINQDYMAAKTTITVYCHGESDSMTLNDSDLMRLGPDAVNQLNNGDGVAFGESALRIDHQQVEARK